MKIKRFPKQKRSKLIPKRDGPFQILERFNDNTYKMNLLDEYGVNATFNVFFFIALFGISDDSRLNLF
jgi:hypothetical protein